MSFTWLEVSVKNIGNIQDKTTCKLENSAVQNSSNCSLICESDSEDFYGVSGLKSFSGDATSS